MKVKRKAGEQVVTLNVAINSQNNSLITLLVANNFTELKGHVFKRFDEGTLLQVTLRFSLEASGTSVSRFGFRVSGFGFRVSGLG